MQEEARDATDTRPPGIDEFLRRPNHAVLATLRPDGSPHTAVTWYDWEDGRVLLNMEATRLRLAWMAHDGRVALSAINPDSFYEHVSLLGRIVDIHDDGDMTDIDRLSLRYTGGPYPVRDAPRVSAWMEVDAYHGFDPAAYAVIGPQADADAWKKAS